MDVISALVADNEGPQTTTDHGELDHGQEVNSEPFMAGSQRLDLLERAITHPMML